MLSLIGKVAGDLGFEVDVVAHASFFMAAHVRRKPDQVDQFLTKVRAM